MNFNRFNNFYGITKKIKQISKFVLEHIKKMYSQML